MKNLHTFDKLFEYKTLQSLKENPAFIDWFSDSKIINSTGEPLIVYHGTTKEFSDFSHAHKDSNTDIVNNLLGFYFTDNPANSDIYVSKRFDVNRGFKKGASVMPVVLKMVNPIRLTEKDYWQMAKTLAKNEMLDYKEQLIIDGYDGIIWEQSVWKGDKMSKDYTIFESSQSRSLFSF